MDRGVWWATVHGVAESHTWLREWACMHAVRNTISLERQGGGGLQSNFGFISLVLWLYLVTQLCLTLCNPMDCSPPGSSVYRDSPGKNTGVGCYALLQGIFPTQGLNPGLPHCRQILLPCEPQGKPSLIGPLILWWKYSYLKLAGTFWKRCADFPRLNSVAIFAFH